MQILNFINRYIDIILESLGVYGPLLGCILICIESIVPFLPLSAFITLNFLTFGNLVGFTISWGCTIVGCMLSFFLFRNKLKKWFDQKRQQKVKLERIMKVVEGITFSQLVIIISIPFTPAFLINIAAGLSKISSKRFLFALMIGKIFLVYFWGYIGVSLVESFKNPLILLKVLILMAVAYLISKLVNKKFKLD